MGSKPAVDDNVDRAPLDVPYDEVAVPDDSDKDNFNAYQRRSVLLDRILDAGHPRALPKTQQELASEFGVSQSTISDDLRVLAEWCGENLTREHFGIMDNVFRSAVSNLVKEEEWRDAAKVGKEWFDWLADVGAVERAPDRVDLDVTSDALESDSYEIIPDDEEDAVGGEA